MFESLGTAKYMLWVLFSLGKYTGNSCSVAVACSAALIAGQFVPARQMCWRSLLWGLLVPVGFPGTTAMLLAVVVHSWFSCLQAMRNNTQLSIWLLRIRLFSCVYVANGSMEGPVGLYYRSMLLARGWWCVNMTWRMGPDLQRLSARFEFCRLRVGVHLCQIFIALNLTVRSISVLCVLGIWSSQCDCSMTFSASSWIASVNLSFNLPLQKLFPGHQQEHYSLQTWML